MARLTFATTVALSKDVPNESVSKMLGRKSSGQTQKYIKILNKKLGQDIKGWQKS